jgi:hypothetical protein
MSLDLWLTIDAGGDEPAEVGDLNWNYTHNVNPMWRLLFGGQSLGQYLEGKTCAETKDCLALAVRTMRAFPEVFKPLNPENGWGDYDGALVALERVAEAAAKYPKASWMVSR